MDGPMPKSQWLDRFSRRVVELLPKASPAEAWRDAEAIFEVADEMSPESAADIWVSVPIPESGDLGDLDAAGSLAGLGQAAGSGPQGPIGRGAAK